MKITSIHAQKNTDIAGHLITLYSSATSIQAKKVLELGVRYGESTVALCEAVHETGGELISVDINPCDAAKDAIREHGFSKRWTFIQSDDIQYGLSLEAGIVFDLIFVDTSHEYDHTKKEIEVFEPKLRGGGIMCFHDTELAQAGVKKSIEEFLLAHRNYSLENIQGRCLFFLL